MAYKIYEVDNFAGQSNTILANAMKRFSLNYHKA